MKTKSTLVKLVIVMIAIATNTSQVAAQWVAQTAPSGDSLTSVSFADVSSGMAVGINESSFSSVAFKTNDGGATWTSFNNGSTLFCVHLTDLNTGYMGGLDTIFKTVDGGSSWTPYFLNAGSNALVFNIYFYDLTFGLASVFDFLSNEAAIYYTTNAGMTWTASTSSIATAGPNTNLYCVSNTTCYAVGWNGQSNGIFKSVDGGITWSNIGNPNADLASVFFTSSTTGFVAGGGSSWQGIYKTTDSGNTWNMVYNSNGNGINSIVFTSSNVGYAAGGINAGGSTVLKTTDGGATWNPMTTPTNNLLYAIDFPDANTGYAVGEAGTILKYVIPSGIMETDVNSNLIVYPNPASNLISVEIPDRNNVDLTINIYNVIGKLVKTELLKQYQKEIAITDLANGIYFVEVRSEEWMGTKKLLVEK